MEKHLCGLIFFFFVKISGNIFYTPGSFFWEGYLRYILNCTNVFGIFRGEEVQLEDPTRLPWPKNGNFSGDDSFRKVRAKNHQSIYPCGFTSVFWSYCHHPKNPQK